jgi:hypothetical protein
MKQLSSTYIGVLVLATPLLMHPLEASPNKHHREKVKYVKGGACAPGKGTKGHPYATLEEAQNHEWDTLIVLSSTIPLDGGIDLKSGQKLIGEENPTCITLSPTQPIITNSFDSMNGGHGAVVHGNATIENIYFQNTRGSGINYNDAVNLTVKNVLVTGHNRNGSGASGISGECTQSGKAHIEHVKIGQSFSTGIFDKALSGAQRELFVCASEIFDTAPGIITDTIGAQTTKHTTIRDCYIHDLNPFSSFGLGCAGFQGGHNSVSIEHSVFYNVGGFHTIIGTSKDPDSTLKLEVHDCHIEELTQVFNRRAIRMETFTGTVGELVVENTTSINTDIFVGTDADASSPTGNTQKVTICGNSTTGRVFYQQLHFAGLTAPATKTTTRIKNNTFNGISKDPGFETRALEIFAFSPWLTFDITVLNNCFFSSDGGQAFLINSFNDLGAGTITLNAHCNTISGFDVAIDDFNANAHYLVSENWWGPAPVNCSSNLDCEPYQTCAYGRCLGPNVVITQPGFPVGNLDASNPLPAPITCHHTTCWQSQLSNQPPLDKASTPNGRPLQTREDILTYVQEMKKSYAQKR